MNFERISANSSVVRSRNSAASTLSFSGFRSSAINRGSSRRRFTWPGVTDLSLRAELCWASYSGESTQQSNRSKRDTVRPQVGLIFNQSLPERNVTTVCGKSDNQGSPRPVLFFADHHIPALAPFGNTACSGVKGLRDPIRPPPRSPNAGCTRRVWVNHPITRSSDDPITCRGAHSNRVLCD
jgi:hypothetical protein